MQPVWDSFDFAWGGAQSTSDDDDGSGASRPRPVLAIEDGDVDPEGVEEDMEEDMEEPGEDDADSESVPTTQPEQSREVDEYDTELSPKPAFED